ncbi:MAG: efflux RND transporter periplasmic adaptor subunit [Flavobacteriaceae bacterium]|jgi:HlyD family secretion protein|nr:efflux RND transporter periplasmic adaptor subunit [Flavobacteriaceae bacterium]MDG1968838.1 efflux RND transporter periplasmic adaptor subunit [Flavobacteriaceae bacterium]CAI8231285.1 MAG: Multidrug resistance protein MdtE [Flavobacteriaceae bacterium]HCZ10531.1 efflux transporter periplasmic adaptor subunit [Flavobacteriaceae bacterium]|tara:strand:+ start:21 stop:1145 length:1125 start_codon:yes stop_codon:yes gene_type:complete
MKILKYFAIGILVLGAIFATLYFVKTNSKTLIEYDVQVASIQNIEKKTVVTGKVIPEDEVEIKPQISGIIEELYVEEGDLVSNGDLLAKVKVVPNEQALNSAKGRLSNTLILLKNAEVEFKRNETLFKKEIISQREYDNAKLNYDQAQQNVENARTDLQIIKLGSAGGSSIANTNIRATVPGTVLEIPIKEGDQVIESNTFNAGTTIATVADLNKMIFEGKVDEAEVAKLIIGMPLKVTLGAIEDESFDAQLKFIAPKGNEEDGTVQFKIEGDVYLNDSVFIRAGYSANASLVLEKKDSIMAISEALLQFDKVTNDPYVEIKNDAGEFERKDIEVGISDGINVEVISGIEMEDEIKVWNKTEPIKIGEEEESNN